MSQQITTHREVVHTRSGPQIHVHTTTWLVHSNGNREELRTQTRKVQA